MTRSGSSRGSRNALCASRDLAYQSDRLLNHLAADIEMGAGPDPTVHHREQHAALAQAFDHVVTADPCATRLEEDQIRFRLLNLHSTDLHQSARQCPSVGVIVGEAVNVVVQCLDASGGANAGLAHGAAQPLLPAPDLVDEFTRSGHRRPNWRAQSFGKIDPGGIPAHRHVAGADAGGNAGVQEPSAVHVGSKPVVLCYFRDLVESGFLPDRAAADVGGLLDADYRLGRLISTARVKRPAESVGR